MECQGCGGKATILIRRKGPEGASDLSLCDACAAARGISARSGSIELSMGELLGRVGEENQVPGTCPDCGMDLRRLLRRGRFGCPSCLGVFKDHLDAPRRADAPSPASAAPSPEDPALLRSYLRLGRNFPDLPFPGPGGGSPSSLAKHTDHRASPLLARAGYSVTGLDVSPATVLEELAQIGDLPPSWLADPQSLLAKHHDDGFLCLLDVDDHLSWRGARRGLALAALESETLAEALRLEAWYEPAKDPDWGYLTARLGDCGRGLQGSVLLHLPALARSGLIERLARGLLGRGWSFEGHYGTEEGGAGSSAGDLWLLSPGTETGLGAGRIEEEARSIAAAETRARAELFAAAPHRLLDRAGRALGILSYAQECSQPEALTLLSDLRLGLLTGLLGGLPRESVDELLVAFAGRGKPLRPKGSPTELPRRGPDADRIQRIRSRLGLPDPAPRAHIEVESEGRKPCSKA